MKTDNENPLAMTEKLFAFLQGDQQDCKIPKKERIKLTPDQAWTVIWYLGNLYWQVTDHVERCDVCGEIYDTWNAGSWLDYGRAPYSFCDTCMEGEEFTKKMRRNPDKEARAYFFAR